MSNTAPHPSAYIVNNSGAAMGTSPWTNAASMGSFTGPGTIPTGFGSPYTAGASAPTTGSIEMVAWSMLLSIACCEGVCVNTASGVIMGGATRQWILNTYAECLQAARGNSAPATAAPGDMGNQVGSFRHAG